ncbi:hypothetical protein N7468_002175 [Penicillium chermesinum]|uniref:Transcription factor domain-containing protein n=1 Tax=Penicillium chermesinum TaxID=63820 RepID=A0A9W9TXR1_9EURO|nr:uncharacterized protein N7468_002175 [Penicillium chermesinum]KAJ5247192.1 hypothetical protein N7468_002175 [Penicillium chermesinum]KAJ6145436.1 hypothetical protein N7470_009331 [Penicillium chermesinum]
MAEEDYGDLQAASTNGRGAAPSLAHEELPKQIECLMGRKFRIAELEKSLATTQRAPAEYIDTPRSRTAASLNVPLEASPSHSYHSPPIIPPGPFSVNSDTHSLAGSHAPVITDGPLKTLNDFQSEDPVEYELHDPIARSVLTEGEAFVMFRLFFSSCHPNAPFLDVELDSDVDRVRSNSIFLFLAILCVGARFWGASSKSACWLHPRYPGLVRLLDAEVMRVTLRPGPDDQKLETVQALMLCAHWMPFDISADGKRDRSRFSESGAWQCLGLATRWATSLALERSCHLSFQNPDRVTRKDVQRFRTMLYLTESDHYLALSARRPSYLNPEPLNNVLHQFLRCKYVQTTDKRLTSLFRVAYGAHFTGCRPTTIESVEAFDKDVQIIERQFTLNRGNHSLDSLGHHFPFISLRWYRLSYACAFLDVTDPSQRTGKVLTWAIEWSSQILIHLSRPPSLQATSNSPILLPLQPDPGVIQVLSYAIDHYFVVIAYAAFVLVNSWLGNLMDMNFRPHIQQAGDSYDNEPSSSLLFRLVDLAARTLEAASPPTGHLARRYVPLLRGMTGIILSGNTQARATENGHSAVVEHPSHPHEQQGNLGGDLWEMWQQAGLEPMPWPNVLDDIY